MTIDFKIILVSLSANCFVRLCPHGFSAHSTSRVTRQIHAIINKNYIGVKTRSKLTNLKL